MNKFVILITGASSGIGYEAARMLAENGHKVYGAARRTERMELLRQYVHEALIVIPEKPLFEYPF